ncbi:MAG: serine hydrolase [Gammaproteobacteria bacterium]|nr:serine hydrolase [Gammaproteobacteria bacterium]
MSVTFLSRTCLFFALALCTETAFSCTDERIEQLTGDIPALMSNAKVVGMNVSLICAGERYWQESFGLANADSNRKLHIDDLFEAASNGKMITAYLVQILANRGVLSLEEEVGDPRLSPAACGSPTVRELLSHTAGLSNDIMAQTFVTDCEQKGNFSYAGQGYLVIQALLEQKTQMNTDALFAREVFEPLGMTATTFASLPPNKLVSGHGDLVLGFVSRRAPAEIVKFTGYSLLASFAALGVSAFLLSRNRTWKLQLLTLFATLVLFLGGAVAILAQIIVPVAAGNRGNDLASTLKTNVTDLSTFVIELLNPSQLDSIRTAELFVPVVEVNADTYWGSGFGVDKASEPPTVWHWGANPGFQSLVVMEPETGNAVIVLTNTGGLLDYFSETRGGHNAAKSVARIALNRNGHWDIN